MNQAMPPLEPPHWHAVSATQAAEHLATDPAAGLSEAEAASRLLRHGENRLPLPPGKSALRRFGEQLAQPLVLVLIAAGTVTAFLGEWVDAGVIFGVVLVNALIGYVQEGKAEAALAALAGSLAAEAMVLREGGKRRLPAHALVPGDVVLLAAGDRVPADLRLCETHGLRAMEASLTGESTAVDKHSETLPQDTVLADRGNMAMPDIGCRRAGRRAGRRHRAGYRNRPHLAPDRRRPGTADAAHEEDGGLLELAVARHRWAGAAHLRRRPLRGETASTCSWPRWRWLSARSPRGCRRR